MEKMTTRTFYEMIKGYSEVLPQEAIDFATQGIEKLDLANERKKGSPRKGKPLSAEDMEAMETIMTYLLSQDEPSLAKDITSYLNDNGYEVKPQKVSGLLTRLVNQGRVKKNVPEKRSQPVSYEVVQGAE